MTCDDFQEPRNYNDELVVSTLKLKYENYSPTVNENIKLFWKKKKYCARYSEDFKCIRDLGPRYLKNKYLDNEFAMRAFFIAVDLRKKWVSIKHISYKGWTVTFTSRENNNLQYYSDQ